MKKTLIASTRPMTDEQIKNLVDRFRAELTEHRDEFGFEAVQDVLGLENIGEKALRSFREDAEMISDTIIRRVRVDRERTLWQVLQTVKRSLYEFRIGNIPNGKDDEVIIHFFWLGRRVSNEELEEEYTSRWLKPADPLSLAALNEHDLFFADRYPNCTHWKDDRGNWCCLVFSTHFSERNVFLCRHPNDYDDRQWFAGIPIE